MNTKELIEKQISEAIGCHDRAVRARHSADLNSFALFTLEICERLLQIVQNQQSQIEALSERCDTIWRRADQDDSPAGMFNQGFFDKLANDVKARNRATPKPTPDSKCVCTHLYEHHAVDRCRMRDCHCRSFRAEVKR